MRRNAAHRLTVVSLLLLAAATAPASGQEGPPTPPPPGSSTGNAALVKAERLLKEMTAAYQAAPVYADRIVARYSYGGSPRQPFEATLLFGPDTDARIVSGGNTVTAVDGKVAVEYPRFFDRYLEVPLDRDVITTVHKLFGRYGGPMAPAAFRYGKPLPELVDVLGYGLPDKARVSGYREITNVDGEPREQISLVSASGSVAVNVDPETKFIDTLALEYVSANAPVPNFRVTLDLAFNPVVSEKLEKPITFDAAGRLPFSRYEALAGNAFPENVQHVKVTIGEPAPDFSAHTIEGVKVDLASLRGSVAVLCFWAKRNTHSQDAMHVMQEVADWASTSQLPVQVWPFYTLGDGGTTELWERATQYFDNHPFTIGCLMDEGNAVAARYGITGVPMLVIIDQLGNVASVRSGSEQIEAEAIKKDILASLGAAPPGS